MSFISLEDKLSILPYSSFEHVWRGGGGGPVEKADYAVLNVAVLTLWLIIAVELFRHFLEHSSKDKPFFKRVLDGIYRELATLGLVEFFSSYVGNLY